MSFEIRYEYPNFHILSDFGLRGPVFSTVKGDNFLYIRSEEQNTIFFVNRALGSGYPNSHNACRDDHGFLYIVEHKKDGGTSGGKHAFQVDLAELLLENNKVQDAGVMGKSVPRHYDQEGRNGNTSQG